MRSLRAVIRIGMITAVMSVVPALAQDTSDKSETVYTVQDVAVDVTADSASTARRQAFDNAQRKAFETLLERLVGEGTLKQINMPKSQRLGTFVKNYGIENEQVSKVRYKADYTFTFDKQAVRNFLSDRDIAYSETKAEPLLVLPFFQQGTRLNLWRGYNPWLDVWSEAQVLDGLLPLEVPIGDLSDIRKINGDNALTYKPEDLETMLGRYDAREAVLLIAAFNEGPPPRSKDAPAYTPLTIYIYRTDNKAPQFVRSLHLRPETGTSLSDLLKRGMRDVADFLRKDWKAQTAVQPGQRETIEAIVHFNSLEEWLAMQARLRELGGVDDLNLHELSANRARLALGYRGSMQQFGQTLRRDGLQANTFHPSRRNRSDGDNNPVMNIRKETANSQPASRQRWERRDQLRQNRQDRFHRNPGHGKDMRRPSRNKPQSPNQYYPDNRGAASGNTGYDQRYQDHGRGY